MSLPLSFLAESFLDYDSEISGFAVPVITTTSGNFTANGILASALVVAIGNVVLGTNVKREEVASRIVSAATPPSDVHAQRENKWLLRYHGATLGQKFQVSLPTADLTLLSSTDRGFMDVAGSEFIALKAAFENYVRSPDDASEAVILDSAQFVGRNT